MLAKPGAWLGVGVGGDEPPLRHSSGGKAEDGNCYTRRATRHSFEMQGVEYFKNAKENFLCSHDLGVGVFWCPLPGLFFFEAHTLEDHPRRYLGAEAEQGLAFRGLGVWPPR